MKVIKLILSLVALSIVTAIILYSCKNTKVRNLFQFTDKNCFSAGYFMPHQGQCYQQTGQGNVRPQSRALMHTATKGSALRASLLSAPK
jgi:hypothetical protein